MDEGPLRAVNLAQGTRIVNGITGSARVLAWPPVDFLCQLHARTRALPVRVTIHETNVPFIPIGKL